MAPRDIMDDYFFTCITKASHRIKKSYAQCMMMDFIKHYKTAAMARYAVQFEVEDNNEGDAHKMKLKEIRTLSQEKRHLQNEDI